MAATTPVSRSTRGRAPSLLSEAARAGSARRLRAPTSTRTGPREAAIEARSLDAPAALSSGSSSAPPLAARAPERASSRSATSSITSAEA